MKTAFLNKRQDYLLVQSFPGFWTIQALPLDLKSTDLIEEYAQRQAQEEGIHVILVRSGREYVHFNHDGRKSRTFRHKVSETKSYS